MNDDNTITQISLDELHESPFNYRKRFDEASLYELAADIKAHGRILSPLLVRPRIGPLFAGDRDAATGFEIVFGHRRYRAAQLAGLTQAPCMVRALTDEEAKKAQISENLAREDVHPIEEAEGFQALIDDHGMTADLIAEQQGKSRSYVYGRLKLLQACPQIRKACLAGEIGSEVALLIARLRTGKLQEKALGYIQGKGYDLKDGGARSYRYVRELLNERFTLSLKSAMFDIEDEMLVPLAGHCIRCPKRAANAPEYADVVEGKKASTWSHQNYGADVCTDPDCFDAKKKAHLKREAEKLAGKGAVVIDGNKARAAIDASGNVKGAYIALKDVQAELKKAPKKSLAGIDLPAPEVVSIQDPRTGKVVKAVKLEDVKAAGVKVKEAKASDNSWERRQAADRAKREEREAKAKELTKVHLAILDRTMQAMDGSPRTTQELYWMAELVFEGTDWGTRCALAKRHGFESPDKLEKVLGEWTPDRLALFAVECMLMADAVIDEYDLSRLNGKIPAPRLMASAAHYAVDIEAVRAEVTGAAPTPSPAARAPKNATAGASAKKAKAAPAAKKAKGQEKGEGQKDDAGVAGGSTGQAELLEDAEA